MAASAHSACVDSQFASKACLSTTAVSSSDLARDLVLHERDVDRGEVAAYQLDVEAHHLREQAGVAVTGTRSGLLSLRGALF
jgi:hypothetical protein